MFYFLFLENPSTQINLDHFFFFMKKPLYCNTKLNKLLQKSRKKKLMRKSDKFEFIFVHQFQIDKFSTFRKFTYLFINLTDLLN